jgi:hypothetical protein
MPPSLPIFGVRGLPASVVAYLCGENFLTQSVLSAWENFVRLEEECNLCFCILQRV